MEQSSDVQAINIVPDADPQELCHFSIIAPDLDEDGHYSSLRYGLQNESARLNLNALIAIDKQFKGMSDLTGGMDLSSLGIPSDLSGGAASGASGSPVSNS